MIQMHFFLASQHLSPEWYCIYSKALLCTLPCAAADNNQLFAWTRTLQISTARPQRVTHASCEACYGLICYTKRRSAALVAEDVARRAAGGDGTLDKAEQDEL